MNDKWSSSKFLRRSEKNEEFSPCERPQYKQGKNHLLLRLFLSQALDFVMSSWQMSEQSLREVKPLHLLHNQQENTIKTMRLAQLSPTEV